jgi:hypothetical protein
MKHVASTTKKFLAAGGLVFGLAGFGLFAGVGTAVADGTEPDSGSYDEQTDLAQEACTGGIPSPSDTASGAFDVSSSAGTLDAALPNPGEAGCEHNRVTSSYPAGASYPAASSWPGGNAKP